MLFTRIRPFALPLPVFDRAARSHNQITVGWATAACLSLFILVPIAVFLILSITTLGLMSAGAAGFSAFFCALILGGTIAGLSDHTQSRYRWEDSDWIICRPSLRLARSAGMWGDKSLEYALEKAYENGAPLRSMRRSTRKYCLLMQKIRRIEQLEKTEQTDLALKNLKDQQSEVLNRLNNWHPWQNIKSRQAQKVNREVAKLARQEIEKRTQAEIMAELASPVSQTMLR